MYLKPKKWMAILKVNLNKSELFKQFKIMKQTFFKTKILTLNQYSDSKPKKNTMP